MAEPLIIFLPKLIQRAMKADALAVIDMSGKNGAGPKSILDWICGDGRAGAGTRCGSVTD
ncbi:MAG: hypothetical protein STSR0009_28470 [Methanoregula sp.]